MRLDEFLERICTCGHATTDHICNCGDCTNFEGSGQRCTDCYHDLSSHACGYDCPDCREFTLDPNATSATYESKRMSLEEYGDNDTALLPTSKRMNPASPAGAEFYDEDQVIFVMTTEEGGLRCVTGFGDTCSSYSGWPVGSRHEIRHDQSGRRLGYWRVIGTKDSTGQAGTIPNQALPHLVFK
jgi:hypothetical protein